jgi:hypothetical protein
LTVAMKRFILCTDAWGAIYPLYVHAECLQAVRTENEHWRNKSRCCPPACSVRASVSGVIAPTRCGKAGLKSSVVSWRQTKSFTHTENNLLLSTILLRTAGNSHVPCWNPLLLPQMQCQIGAAIFQGDTKLIHTGPQCIPSHSSLSLSRLKWTGISLASAIEMRDTADHSLSNRKTFLPEVANRFW